MDQIDRLKAVVETLRSETGCPWDRAQTHASLKPPCIEEAAEVVCGVNILEATGDPANLREELGDLLLQVVFHAVLAEEEGYFTLEDVARAAAEKMIRRHPHVFAAPTAGTAKTSPACRGGGQDHRRGRQAPLQTSPACRGGGPASRPVEGFRPSDAPAPETERASWEEIKKHEKQGREWESAYLEAAMREASALIDQAMRRKGFAPTFGPPDAAP